MRYVVIFLVSILLLVLGACKTEYVVVQRCQPLPEKTLRTVQDHVLRRIELETYLKECTK